MKNEKVIEYIVEQMRNYCVKYNMKGFTVGVSGGIDSAVTSALCAKTGKNVTALSMPIRQAADQLSRADSHINSLEKLWTNVKGVKIDLTSAFNAIEQTLPPDISDNKLTMANTRARLRMLTLYAFASHNNMLVAGTGNKVEDFGIGFFTKYGDGAVDISPIGDLLKSEVYEIGKTLDVSKKIIESEPTDGLWDDNRTDKGQIGVSYPMIEWAMQNTEENLDGEQKKVLAIYKKFRNSNMHKMLPIPVIKVPDSLR